MILRSRRAAGTSRGTTAGGNKDDDDDDVIIDSAPDSSHINRSCFQVLQRPSFRFVVAAASLFASLAAAFALLKTNLNLGGGAVDISPPANGDSRSAANHRRKKRPACAFTVRSVRDIQQCYPGELVRRLPPSCYTGEIGNNNTVAAVIESWDDVQRCLTGRFMSDRMQQQQRQQQQQYEIHILGERHCGTKFVTSELQSCFQKNRNMKKSMYQLQLKVHRDLVRSKHFFQPVYHEGVGHPRSIVVALFRDPYDWIAAMREKPYHAPDHVLRFGGGGGDNDNNNVTADGGVDEDNIVPLPWRDFVSKPWTTGRSKQDMELVRQNRALTLSMPCYNKFDFVEVVPCLPDLERLKARIPESRWRGFVPVYELLRDGSGKPFDDLLQLRSAKIVNFLLELPMLYGNADPRSGESRLGGYAAARYEDLVRNGTRFLLEQIATMMGMQGLPDGCNPSPGGKDDKYLRRRHIPDDFRQWIDLHLDRDVERLLGYGQIRVNQISTRSLSTKDAFRTHLDQGHASVRIHNVTS